MRELADHTDHTDHTINDRSDDNWISKDQFFDHSPDQLLLPSDVVSAVGTVKRRSLVWLDSDCDRLWLAFLRRDSRLGLFFAAMTRQRVSYFYHNDVGNYQYAGITFNFKALADVTRKGPAPDETPPNADGARPHRQLRHAQETRHVCTSRFFLY
jgi:hypothetical protein